MADVHSERASAAGLEENEAHHGSGALLARLQGRLNPEASTHLQNTIPNSERMLSVFPDRAASAGGDLLNTVKGMAAKFMEGQDRAALQNPCASAGLSADKLRSLLPQLHDMLAGRILTHALDQIKPDVVILCLHGRPPARCPERAARRVRAETF